MSKLFEHYKNCKEITPEKVILIKSGTFYLILDEDAKSIGERLGLKITNLNESVVKCGFPINSFSKYERMLIANNIDFIVTDMSSFKNNNKDIEKNILKEIRNLDINSISPVKALNLLAKYNDKLKNK